jgi:hypothetical protein
MITVFVPGGGNRTVCTGVSRGSVKKKVEPFPISDSSHRRPPLRSPIFLQIARPMPVPGISPPCQRCKREFEKGSLLLWQIGTLSNLV